MLRSAPTALALVLTAVVAAAASCGGGEASTTTSSSASTTGTGGAGTGGGAGGMGTGGAVSMFPAPVVAGTPETDALASAAAVCGQPAFAWVKDATLGQVTAHTEKTAYTQSLLQTLATAAGISLPQPLQFDVDTHVITYVTQDRGKTIEASAVVAFPTSVPEGAAPLPTLVVLHGTSGFTDGCGPSADTSSYPLYAALASTGFIVVVPDYIGLEAAPPPTGFLHPYLAGQPTAIAALDAARAVGNLPAEIRVGGAKPSTTVAVVGGSQGGHAALWVDRLAPYYARELDIAGVVATVPPADMLTEAYLALTMVRDSTSNMIAFYGATAGWYGAAGKLGEVFVSPLDTQVPAALGASCDPGDVVQNVTALDQVFQQPLLDAAAAGATFASLSPWGCMVAENGLPTTSVKRIQKDPSSYGILFVTGSADTLVDTDTERGAFQTLCEAGMPMQYLECAGASHTKVTTWALPEILSFVADRVAGKAFAPSCDTPAATTCLGTPKP